MHVHRLEQRFCRAGKAQELIDQGIDPIDLVSDQIGEGFTKIGILVTLRQKLGKSLDRDERVLDFMRHASGKRAETGEPIAAANLQFETLQRGDIGQDHEAPEHFALLPVEDRAARAHDHAAFRLIPE